MPQRKLFAVLCAINDYNWPVSALKGCVNDAEEWQQLLDEQNDYFDIRITQLRNEEAVKQNIITALSVALDEAGPNDVVFFYYSGHGAQETSHDVFQEIDSDGSFEALVCYDGITHDGELFHFNLISDKELHYVLSKHGKEGTHIVLILDSCHSGNITRNAIDFEDGSIRKRQFKPPIDAESRLSMKAPQREWSDFVFGEAFSAAEISEKGWFNLIPQMRHIAMSACLNDESAFEVEGHGIFTTNLVKVLRRTQCEISYRSLQARVRQFVRNQLNQTPEIYSTKEHAEDLLLNFLSKEGAPRPYRANCTYSEKNNWTIDLGSMHGVRKNSGPVIIETEQGKLTVELDSVSANYSGLLLSEEQFKLLNNKYAYNARVANYLNGGTSFLVEHEKNVPFSDRLKEAYQELTSSKSYTANITSVKSEAQYVIDAKTDCITIIKNSVQKDPVWRVTNDDKGIGRLIRAMSHISKWEYVRSYDNPEAEPDEKYGVEVYLEVKYPDRDAYEVPVKRNQIEIPFVKGATMRIRLDNNSGQKYFCALLYLSNTFDVTGGLVDGKVKGVPAKTSEWALSGQSIPVTMEQHVTDFNMQASLSYLKLIANEEAFHVDAMEQGGLPPPKPKCGDNIMTTKSAKGLEVDRGISKITWFTRTIELKVLNQDSN